MTRFITAVLLCLLSASQWVYADEWIPFRISGLTRLYDTKGLVELKHHTAGQLTFTALDEPVQLSGPSTGLELMFLTRHQDVVKIADKITADPSAKWAVSGQIKVGARAEIMILPTYKNFFPYFRGMIYAPVVIISGNEPDARHTINVTLKSPVRAKNDAFAIANSQRTKIAPHPTPATDPAISLAVQTAYENALAFVMDPVILAAKADFASRTHDFPTCANELHRLIENHKETTISGQAIPKRVQRAYYGRMTCLYKQALRTKMRNDWLALIQACHEALIDQIKLNQHQYFTTWYDALLILTQSIGKQNELAAALYTDELLRNSWTVLYYTHYIQSAERPLDRNLRTEIKRFTKHIGR